MLAAILAATLAVPVSAQAARSRCERFLTEAEMLADHITASQDELSGLFANSVEQARNWREFLSEPAPAGDKIHILHQTGIKDLNETLWNMTGTEDYLEAFHDILHLYLRTNPVLGKILHNDYKNHFVLSSLDGPAFDRLVVKPVLERLVNQMQARQPDINWASWVPRSVFHGTGHSPNEAYFHAAMTRARFIPDAKALSYAKWQAQAVARRARLERFALRNQLDWDELLITMHNKIGKGNVEEVELRRWLEPHDPDGRIFDELERYCDDLQVADFHPLPDPGAIPLSLEEFLALKRSDPLGNARANWAVERRAMFTMVEEARYVVVSDIQGLGGTARRFQDQWIARGARLEQLPDVYARSTLALREFFGHIYERLKAIAGPSSSAVRVYWSGDDAIWFLPSLDGPARESVLAFFTEMSRKGEVDQDIELKLHHSNLMRVDGRKPPADGVAQALMRARTSLFARKERYKTYGTAPDAVTEGEESP